MNPSLSGGLQSPIVATLVFSAVAALLALLMGASPASVRKTGIVALPIALLAALVLVVEGYVLLGGTMLVAAVAEMLLVQDRLAAYVTGLGVMLAVRVAYAVLFSLGTHSGLLTAEIWRGAAVVAIALAGAAFVWRVFPYAGPLRWPAVIFGIVDVVLCVAAAGLHPPFVFLGVVIVAAADVGTAAERFLWPSDRETPAAVVRLTWLGRYVGQALIALTALRII